MNRDGGVELRAALDAASVTFDLEFGDVCRVKTFRIATSTCRQFFHKDIVYLLGWQNGYELFF